MTWFGLLLPETIHWGQVRCSAPEHLCVCAVAKASGQLQAAQRGAARTQQDQAQQETASLKCRARSWRGAAGYAAELVSSSLWGIWPDCGQLQNFIC